MGTRPTKQRRKKPNKRAITNRLLIAAGKFINAYGGKALVVGGVYVQQRADGLHRFQLCIDITGAPPITKSDRPTALRSKSKSAV